LAYSCPAATGAGKIAVRCRKPKVEIANIHAGVMHVSENMIGWQKRLGEYPTLSATLSLAGINQFANSAAQAIYNYKIATGKATL